MRCTNRLAGFVAGVLLISGTSASPCKPSTTLQSSQAVATSITGIPYSESTSTIFDTSSIAETISTITTTNEAATETTSITEASSTVVSTTTDAPEPITTFALVAANAAVRTEVNGETLKYQTSNPSILMVRPASSAASNYQTGHFSVEPVTNRLKMGNVYVIAYASPSWSLATASDDNRARYVICTPPLVLGQKLSCVAQASDRNKWMVNAGSENSLFIRSGGEEVAPDQSFDFIDMIVNETSR